jgi:hypothetical protein
MDAKLKFYERYGADEYYLVYPSFPFFIEGWRRHHDALIKISNVNNYRSPRLGILFEVQKGGIAISGTDGKVFEKPNEVARQRNDALREVQLEQHRTQDALRQSNEQQTRAAEANQRAEQEKQRAEQEKQRAEAYRQKLRELGVDPDSL